MNTMNTRKRRGFTLVELLCVMAMLAVIGLVMALLLRETLDVERMQTAGFDQMLQRNALADQFRADVAQAEKVLAEWRDYKGGADTLILQKSKDSHVVYRWNEGSLQRKSFEGQQEVERTLQVGGKDVRVEFIDADSKLVRLRLRTMRDGKAVSGRTVEIAAAVKGDAP
jgi:prepilin-type N-terminal cleavage/methylation domain-containing protein